MMYKSVAGLLAVHNVLGGGGRLAIIVDLTTNFSLTQAQKNQKVWTTCMQKKLPSKHPKYLLALSKTKQASYHCRPDNKLFHTKNAKKEVKATYIPKKYREMQNIFLHHQITIQRSTEKSLVTVCLWEAEDVYWGKQREEERRSVSSRSRWRECILGPEIKGKGAFLHERGEEM